MANPVFQGSFNTWKEESAGRGRRPVVFDILGPDRETSILPEDIKMVLHVNPNNMGIQYNRHVERIQTMGGWVEQHWGDSTQEISFSMASGGFMRLYSGLSNITNPAYGGTRRETLAYEKYLDILALFHNNGSVFDSTGRIVLQGILKMTFDGGTFLGWFTDLTVTEEAEQPYMFNMDGNFVVFKEIMVFRSHLATYASTTVTGISSSEPGQMP